MRHRVFIVAVFLISLCLWLPFSTTHASPATDAGIQWLSTVQSADGYWGKTFGGTPIRDTTAAANVFQTLAPTSPAYTAAIQWLATADPVNQDYLSRRLATYALAGLNTSADVAVLKAGQLADGGWGLSPDHESDVLDTALALEALTLASVTDANVIAPAVGFLLSRQQASGGFAHGDNVPSVYLTALVSSALQVSSRAIVVLDAINRANAWLLSQQKADGSWGEVSETSVVYLALVGTTSDAGLQSRVGVFLLSRQGADGGWNGDAFSTALALRALAAQPRPVPTAGDIVGQVLDGATGVAIVGASAAIPGFNVTSDSAGNFRFTNVPAGNYTLVVNAQGYASKSLTVNVQAGTTVDVQQILLMPAPSVGLLQGVATDAVTGAPLADVLISVTGSATASVLTAADGSYRLINLAPGTVTVSASKAGYTTAGGTGTIVAGGTLLFSPALSPAGTGGPTTGQLQGLATDAVTGAPLADVLISVTGSATASVLTAADGSYRLINLTPGAVTVNASKAGYTSAGGTGTIVAGGALLFSPALSPTGTVPTTGQLQGLATDALTGAALADVLISVTGSATASVLTAADGSYRLINLTPGAVTVSASKLGYASASGTGTIVAGSTLLFSPALPPTAGGIRGQTVDAATQTPLAGVTIAVGSTGPTATSGTDGRFGLFGIPAGTYPIGFSLAGYLTKSLTTLVGAGSTVDFQTVGLSKITTAVTVYGKLTDAATQQPIAQASITALGTGLSAQTDASGAYRLEGLSVGDASLRFSAAGYASETVILSFTEAGEYRVDRALQIDQGFSLKLLSVTTDKPNYPAYAPVSIQMEVLNSGVSLVSGSVNVTLLDAQGHVIESLQATHTGANGVEQSQFDFQPGITLSMTVPWNSAAHAPGVYAIDAKIMQGDTNAAGGGALIVLDTARAVLNIDPTQAIGSLTLTPLPRFSSLGAVEQVGFRADLVNRSNVNTELGIAYQWLSPSGAVLYSDTATIPLLPGESTKSVVLNGLQHTFTESGDHPARAQVVSGPAPAVIDAALIAVAPGTRIDPSQNITPATVTPDGDKRIRIDIRLQGVEQK